MVRTYLKPRLIFDRCIDFLIQRRVQVPQSGVLLELIELMDAHLTEDARALLDDLFTTADDQNRYRLTLLKKLSQSTKPTKIKEAVVDFETLVELHGRLTGPLSALDLGAAGIRYFAGSGHGCFSSSNAQTMTVVSMPRLLLPISFTVRKIT